MKNSTYTTHPTHSKKVNTHSSTWIQFIENRKLFFILVYRFRRATFRGFLLEFRTTRGGVTWTAARSAFSIRVCTLPFWPCRRGFGPSIFVVLHPHFLRMIYTIIVDNILTLILCSLCTSCCVYMIILCTCTVHFVQFVNLVLCRYNNIVHVQCRLCAVCALCLNYGVSHTAFCAL